jgi:hypothetical protein
MDAKRRDFAALALCRRGALEPRVPIERRRDAAAIREPHYELGGRELDEAR